MSWQKVKLGELVEKFSVKLGELSCTDKLEFFGVSNELGITTTKNAAKEKAINYQIIENGCFAYNPYRINVGSIGYYNADAKGLISPAYVVFKTKPNSICPELLLRLLKSTDGLWKIKQLAGGTVRQALRFEDLCKIEISIPSYKEQYQLLEKFSKNKILINTIQTELSYQLELIRKLWHQILSDAIQGKLTEGWRKENPKVEPASELLKRIPLRQVQGVSKKRNALPPISENEMPFELPKGWVWCRLGEISNSSLGKMLDAGKNKGDFKPYLRNINVKWFSIDFLDIKNMKFLPSELDKYSVQRGDVLICEGGYPGRAAIWNEDYPIMFQKALHRVRFVNNSFNAKLFVFYLQKINGTSFFNNYLTGSGILHFTGKKLNVLPIPLPPFAEQKVIVEKIETLLAKCNQLEEVVENQNTYSKNLLKALFNETFGGSRKL